MSSKRVPQYRSRQAIFLLALMLGLLSGRAAADITTLSVADAAAEPGAVVDFPFQRSGDLGYDVFLGYLTADGSAVQGTDYFGTLGVLRIAAGSNGATAGVTLPAAAGVGKKFSMHLAGAVGVGSAPVFSAPHAFASGSGPRFAATGDFNLDGRPDVVTVNNDDTTVWVRLNTTVPGDVVPSFGPAQGFALSTTFSATAVITADVNADGKPDILFTSQGDNTVQVLINKTTAGASSASFESPVGFPSGVSPALSVAVADVNGDGRPDLAIGCGNGSDTTTILMNQTEPGSSTPVFAPAEVVVTGASFAVAFGDFNGDGRTDLVRVDPFSSDIGIAMNETPQYATMPSFGVPVRLDVRVGDQGPQTVTLADFDGDGRLDIATAAEGSDPVGPGASAAVVFFNLTPPGAAVPVFGSGQVVIAGAGSRVSAADLNGDGKPDLVVNERVLQNRLHPGTAVAFFSEPADLAAGVSLAVVGDFNGDGKMDLLGARQDTHEFVVLLNTTPAPTAVFNLADAQHFAVNDNPQSVVIGDLDGDGKVDLSTASGTRYNRSNKISLLYGTSAPGAAAASYDPFVTFTTELFTSKIALGDLDTDGRPDLAFSSACHPGVNCAAPGAGRIQFQFGRGARSFANGIAETKSDIPYAVALADLNGDGRGDVVTANIGSNNVSVLLNTGPGTGGCSGPFCPSQPAIFAVTTYAAGDSPAAVVLGDLNGDGWRDLAVASAGPQPCGGPFCPPLTLPTGLQVLLNHGDGTFGAAGFLMDGTRPTDVAIGDLNGDGRNDIVVANPETHTVSVLFRNDDNSIWVPADIFAAPVDFSAGSAPVAVAIGDMNGDGRPDLVVANSGSGNVSVLLSTGGGRFADARNYPAGSGPSDVAIGDVNADGMPDVVVTNAVSNNVSVLLNTQYRTVLDRVAATGTILCAGGQCGAAGSSGGGGGGGGSGFLGIKIGAFDPFMLILLGLLAAWQKALQTRRFIELR